MNVMIERAAGLCLSLVLLAACEPAAVLEPISIDDVVGAYTANVLETTTDGSTTDHLAEGASISLTLASDGTTEGRLFIPGAAEGGGDFDEDLAGTWSLSDDRVNLDHAADTFLRDMTLLYGNSTLSGSATFGGTKVVVQLVK